MTADFFRFNVLSKFASTNSKEISLRGFLEWFKEWIQSKGTNQAPQIFERLGYDEDLYPFESRLFTMSVQSPKEIVLYVQDRTQSDLPNPNPQLEDIENTINRELVIRHGKSVRNEPL